MIAFVWFAGCAIAADPVVLRNVHLPGEAAATVDVRLRDGVIVEIAPTIRAEGIPDRNRCGRWLAPAAIDSHVHLAYYPVATELADRGVAGAVDWAAPEDRVGTVELGGPRIGWSGPMVTAVGGYPTTSWGAGGYGLEVATADQAEQGVRRLAGRGATGIKLSMEDPQLPDDVLRRAIDTAHTLGLPVAAHALDDAGAARAAAFGADVLAHTPVEPLAPATVAAWSGRAVISTLEAFGGTDAAVANLRALAAADVTVLYGTDLGNTRQVGIDPDELGLLGRAGLDGARILAACTSAPAARWGWTELGAIAVGAEASLLVLDADPTRDPATLSRPVEVWIRGARR
ncbi:MAG: amidohydrolase family protein [Myxococcota bacterium]